MIRSLITYAYVKVKGRFLLVYFSQCVSVVHKGSLKWKKKKSLLLSVLSAAHARASGRAYLLPRVLISPLLSANPSVTETSN